MGQFRGRCAEAGLACTHQRQVIYRALVASPTHPAPEEIFERVRGEMPTISLGTVYKNIRTFAQLGLIREVNVLHERLRLDADLAPHHHLVCTRCKSIEDLAQDALDPVRLRRALPHGFRFERSVVEVLGLCAACARK